MEGICCEICNHDFNDSEVIPKVLECGHSICIICIKVLLQTNALCPKCRKCLDYKEYPTNFALLGFANATNSYKLLETHIHCRIEDMKNKFTIKKEMLSKQKANVVSNLDLIRNALNRLEEIINTESDDFNLIKANEVLGELEKDYKKLGYLILPNYWKLRMNVSISLKNFENSDLYLEKIYQTLLKEKEIYSVVKVEDEIKYGGITVQNNLIVVQHLGLSEMPIEGTSLWFNDLKKCITEEKFRAYLKLSCNEKGVTHMVLIQMMDNQLVPQFIKLCTGEYGQSYKDSYHTNEGITHLNEAFIYVDKYIDNKTEMTGNIDYGVDSVTNVTCNPNDIVLTGSSDGRFQISQVPHALNYVNVIGKVTNPTNLKDLISYGVDNKLKIVDSGFVFQF